MNPADPPLALEVAAGILIAYLVVFFAKSTIAHWNRGDGNLAIMMGALVAFVGGGLILAGMGTIGW